jgi:hypothetical protein
MALLLSQFTTHIGTLYDHIVAIANGGWTGKDNRQPLCASFNRNVKRKQTMDFRANWQNGRFIKRV